jgi:hypothetical protein
MALADYYRRGAIAVSQVLAGFDEAAITNRLTQVRLAIGFAEATAQSPEGGFLLDLLVRLAARLYPALSIRGAQTSSQAVSDLERLAQSINPRLEIDGGEATVGIWVGGGAEAIAPQMFYAGSNGWDAKVSSLDAVTTGDSTNPFGAGASACLVMANVFRSVFCMPSPGLFDENLIFPTLPGPAADEINELDLGETALVGVGAIGNAAIWSLANASLRGRLHLVDHQALDLGNLQRYVLGFQSDQGKAKVEIAARHLTGHLLPSVNKQPWAEFVQEHGYRLPTVMVALDSADGRRAVQASLPGWVTNAWTQPGDLGVSTHQFDGPGACLYCLYLPDGSAASEDAIYSDALRIPDQVMQVRDLLYRRGGLSRELLELIAARMGVDSELVLPYEGREIRELFVEGICGGAVLPLGYTGTPRSEVHVPLAHQSALAGVLLAARMVGKMMGADLDSKITRVNVMRPTSHPEFLTQPALKDPRGICICQDSDYLKTYRAKY